MLYLGILVFAFALLLIVNSSNASAADVYVSGSVDGTWTTGNDYYVVSDATVNVGDTLTIQEGVNVHFDSGTSLDVYGRLIAISTDPNRLINFTSNATVPGAGDWIGINFEDAMTSASTIDGAHVEYATNAIMATDSNVALSNIVINDCSAAGVILIRGYMVPSDLTITLDRLDIMNVLDGIVVQGYDRNLTVTITNCNIMNADNVGIAMTTGNMISTWNLTITGSIADTELSALLVGFNNAIYVSSVGSVALDISDGTSIYDATFGVSASSANGEVELTVNDTVVSRCLEGISVTTNAPEGFGEAIVEVSNSDFSTIGGVAIYVSTAHDNAYVTITDVAVTAANYGVQLRANEGDIDLTVDGFSADNVMVGVQGWCNGSNDISITDATVNDTSIECFGFQSWTDDITATIENCVLTNISFDGIVFNCYDGNVEATVSNVDLSGSMIDGIWVSANNTADLTIEDVSITGASYGVWISTGYETPDLIVLEMTDVDIELSGTGVFLVAQEINLDMSQVVINDTETGIYAHANGAEFATGGCNVILEEVVISIAQIGIDMTSDFGLANLVLSDVTVSGPNLYKGIIVSADSSNASVEIAGLTIEMSPTITVGSDPSFDGINVFANDSISFTASDLSINYSYDGVQLTTINDGMVVDVVGANIINSPEAGILMNSGAGLEITVSDSIFYLYPYIANSYISNWAIEGYAAEGIEATITNVSMNWINGVRLVANIGNIEAVFTEVDITAGAYTAISGIDLQSNEGYVDATFNAVSIDLDRWGWLYDDTTGDGIYILSNGTVSLDLADVNVDGALVNGIYVESVNGMIEATLSSVTVNDIYESGILFYSHVDAVNLALTDSMIFDCGLDGVVAQGALDVNLVFDNVTVDGALDGVLALSTDGNVSADYSDTTVMECQTGIRMLAPNGWILMVMDPSRVQFAYTGIYLDAMGEVDLSIYDSFVGNATIGIEIHSFDGGINVLLDNAELNYTDVYGLFADADNSDIMVNSINGTVMDYCYGVGWYLVTSNGSVSINVEDTTFEYGNTGIMVESSNDLDANVVGSYFLGQAFRGMNLTAGVNITLNVVGSTYDGQIAENAQLFYPTMSEGEYIIIQPETGNWTTNQSMIATLPFNFDFNGGTYGEVLMSLNGWLALGTDGAPNANSVYYDFEDYYPNLIAPAQEYWNASDIEMDGYFHGMGYKYDGELNAVIFQWFVWQADESQLKNVFEVILYESGDIEFRYAMMDGYDVNNYAFGINMHDGPNWDLRMVNEYVLYMDFQSVYFSMEMLSDGAAIYAIAGENMVATIDDSSFSHYSAGGVLLVAVDGLASIDLQGSDFSYIYATSERMGAFVAAALNNLMTADVSECTFDTIGTAAIILADAPSLGGVDSFMVANNHFNEVIITTAIVSVVSDELDSTSSYVSSKTFIQNDGTHVGIMAIATIVIADDVAWSIQETDTIENNDFTGDIDLWLLYSFEEALTVPYLGDVEIDMNVGMMNDIFVFGSEVGDNQIVHSVSVTDNKLNEGPISAYPELGQPMNIGAVNVYEMVGLTGPANLTKQTDVSVLDNEIVSHNAPLVSGVQVRIVESLSNPIDGMLDSNVNVNFVNNTMDSWWGYGVGLGLYTVQELNDGKGEGALDVNVLATDNYVSGFADGIFVGVDTAASNLFGDVVSNVNALVQDNEIYSYYDGVEIALSTEASFQHYFPPYEQVVDSNATMTIDVEVINNTISCEEDGIYVGTSAQATEDEYGVFTNAYASITGPVNVLDNEVTVYYYDGSGIDVESYVQATFSMASAMSNVPVTVVNNTIYNYYGGTGIYVGNFASASTMELRFYDQPNAMMIVELNVMDNFVYYGAGIAIEQSSRAAGGVSVATVYADVVVMGNSLSSIDYTGISVDVSTYTDSIDYYPWAYVNADVLVTENTISGWSSSTGISVTVLHEVGSDGYDTLQGLVSIVNNTIDGAGTGIFASTYVQLEILQNTLSNVHDGIRASTTYSLTIFENTITGVTGYGIWLEEAYGMVENNTIEGAGSVELNDAEGIYIEEAWYLTIQGNTISNVGNDGVHADYLYNVLITLNTFENIGASGVYLSGEEYTSYYVTISSNIMTNLGDSGVEVNDIYWLEVLDNVMTNVSYYGVEVDDASNVLIENNTMTGMYGGIDMYDVSDVNIIDNVMSVSVVAPELETELGQSYDGGYGMDVDYAESIVATGNEMTGFGNGVEFDYVSDLTFTWNVVTGSLGDGAYFYVELATISNNVFSDSGYVGVVIEDSYWVTFADNEVTGSGLDGLLVHHTEALTIVNGMFVDNGEFGIEMNESSVVWNVDAASAVEHNDVLFSGDLTVMAGGFLLLNGVEFIIMSDIEDGLSTIVVLEGGALTTVDVEFYMAGMDEPGLSLGEFYEFNVYGMLDMSNTEVSGALELYLGATSTATIEMSVIADNVRNGIHIVDCAPVIRSCTISSNPRNGIFVEGSAAAPQITDCMIVNNDRGIYAVGATLEQVTDNVIALNSEAGIFAEQMTGRIHDNLLLLNNKEIYVRNSDVSIQDNQIGYTQLVQVIAQFVPLLQGIDMDVDIFLPELGLTISPSLLQGIMLGHVGLYAVDSTVVSSGNQFGMLSTAVQVVNTDLTFGDSIMQNTIILPYMDASNIVRNMSLPIPVYDGIVATDSNVVMNGGSIDVLDDAVFLDHSTATIDASSLSAMDFSIYAIDGSDVTVTDSTFGKVKVEDTSTLDVWEKLTVIVKDPWGTVLANVPVTVGEVDRTTDANGMAVVYIEAYVVTASGKSPMQSYQVTANLTEVPTTSYPGHASWGTPVVSEQVTADGPTTVVMVSSVIVRYDLTVHAMNKDGKNAVNVTVMVYDASGQLVDQAQSNATGVAAFELVSYIKNADGTTDDSMSPYKLTAKIGSNTAQASTNLTENTNLDLKVVVTEFNWGPAIIMGGVAAVMLVAALYVIRRKP